jgi:hypothetical protein
MLGFLGCLDLPSFWLVWLRSFLCSNPFLLRHGKVTEQILSLEKQKASGDKLGKKRKASLSADDDGSSVECVADVQASQASASSAATGLISQLQSLLGVASPALGAASPAHKEEEAKPANQARQAERSRVSAERQAKKAAIAADKAHLKEEAQQKKAATQAVTLAAKTQLLLASAEQGLNAVILSDGAPPQLSEPLQTLKDKVNQMILDADAVLKLSKKKSSSIVPLTFTLSDVTACVSDSKIWIKKVEQYNQLLGQ